MTMWARIAAAFALCLVSFGAHAVTLQTAPSGGASQYSVVSANTNNSAAIKPGTGTVYGLQLGGIGSAPAYVKLYDKATAPTCGTDTPVARFIIPAASTAANGGGSNISIPLGLSFSTGIGICIVTGIGDSDNTAVAASTFIVTVEFK